jgi:RNA-binding protein
VLETLSSRELVKLKVLEAAPESVRATAEALAEKIDNAVVVQVVGRTAVLYRPHPEHAVIRLPH